MDIKEELEALFNGDALQSLGYWLDHQPVWLAERRHDAAKLSLYALVVLSTWSDRESRPIIWTLRKLTEGMKSYVREQTRNRHLDDADELIDIAARQVVLELFERRLLFLVAGLSRRLTADDLDAATFIVKTWAPPQIQDYGEFLRQVSDTQPFDTRGE